MHVDDSEAPVVNGDPAFRRELERVVAEARSLHEIAAWLRSQPGIAAVAVGDFLIKTYPPRRVITFVGEGRDVAEGRRELVVVEHPGGRYDFWDLREG